ncbi:MAG TPA: FAD-dependent oxidoreductase [Ignavibacteriales bacterium]|nr:FAD-dependent oxidoreductase [Ignavibacteriales bacterium]HPD68151.1 FAD-dependent oxidoreductase [Ignavibacteriales bacterium]HRR19664.1 FAD-dependent oxidoreductase [Ignavibacteriales bacterium]
MEKKKILIIGGVAAGATAAARARRLDENAEITIIEKGPFVSFANCGLPYFISGDIKRRAKLLLQTPEGFLGRYNVNVLINTEAIDIKRDEKKVVVKTAEGTKELEYDKLILAQGGSPIIPDIEGVNNDNVFKLWTIPDMDRIHKFIEQNQPKNAVVVGGGFIGIEIAEAFKARGMNVTIVELANQVMTNVDFEFGAMVKSVLEENGVNVLTGVKIDKITGNKAILSNNTEIDADLILFSIGVKPENILAKNAGLEVSQSGAVIVDEYMRTSDPDIYAAGDMVEILHKVSGRKSRIPLAGPANRQGRIAASNALGMNLKYNGALGTSVIKIFDYTLSFTGLSEKFASQFDFNVGVAYTFKDNQVTYYPGGTQLAFKLVYDKSTNKIIGAQAFGIKGVEKRIDVIATALQAKMSLEDLAELDLAYAPPYNSANDPVNIAAFVGQNNISGYSPCISPKEFLEKYDETKTLVLDVRTIGEAAKDPYENALHIPTDELRYRLNEIPTDKTIYILSKDGYLGHIALRILKQKGYNKLYYITGGYSALKWYLNN